MPSSKGRFLTMWKRSLYNRRFIRTIDKLLTDKTSPENKTTPLNWELLLKLTSIILGSLYVLGLLISNIQLMALGVSDFSSLQVRNIMTGFIFFFYVLAVLLILFSPVITYLYLKKTFNTSKRLKFFLFPLTYMCILYIIILTSGTIFGYLYPWGLGYEEYYNKMGSFFGFFTHPWTTLTYRFSIGWNLSSRVFNQFIDTFLHVKTIFATVSVISLTLYYLINRKEINEIYSRKTQYAAICAAFLFCFLPLLLVDFADNVYPNIKYNLGGGQPQIAELQISEEKAHLTKLLGITLSGATSPMKTEPVIIWLQSDKYLYVSPLPKEGEETAQLVMVDIKMIRTIRYLRQCIQVRSGGRIRQRQCSQ
jgi:hypothetical protein